MDAADFRAWLEHMDFNDSEASRQLDITRNTVARYKETGTPLHIALACAALAFGLPAWRRTGQPS